MAKKDDLRGTLRENLKALRLATMRNCFEEVAVQARKESHSYEHYLLELTVREAEDRHGRRTARLLKASNLPLEKSLSAFDRKRLPARVNQQLATLLEGAFLDRRENVLAFGTVGSGKTHALCALGQELIVTQGRQILYRKCALLVQELLLAKRDLKLARVLKRLARAEGLIIDDIPYVPHHPAKK